MPAAEYELVVRRGTVVRPQGTEQADIAVKGGVIERIEKEVRASGATEVDADGCFVVPGGVDAHTHFGNRAPLDHLETADDWGSGSRAAAAGGITTVVNYVFQEPGTGLRETVDEEVRRAAAHSCIDYSVHPVVTHLRGGATLEEIPDLVKDGFSSVKLFTGPLGVSLSDEDIVRLLGVAAEAKALVTVHPEDVALNQFFRKRAVAAIGDGPQGALRAWRASYPPAVEALAVERVAGYARAVGAAVYFVHISSAEALGAVVAARNRGTRAYCETRPAYLFLDASRYSGEFDQAVLNVCLPPLREKDDQEALWQGLRDGTIDAFGSDHTARMANEKLSAARAGEPVPAGFGGVQTGLGLLYGCGTTQGRITLDDLVRVTSERPAKIFGLWPRKGAIQVGSDADLVVLDPAKQVVVRLDMLESKSDFDPYVGLHAVGWPKMTISRGEVLWEDGVIRGSRGRGILVQRTPAS